MNLTRAYNLCFRLGSPFGSLHPIPLIRTLFSSPIRRTRPSSHCAVLLLTRLRSGPLLSGRILSTSSCQLHLQVHRALIALLACLAPRRRYSKKRLFVLPSVSLVHYLSWIFCLLSRPCVPMYNLPLCTSILYYGNRIYPCSHAVPETPVTGFPSLLSPPL